MGSEARAGAVSDSSVLLSVVVIRFRRSQYLGQAIDSLEKQTLDRGRFEVLVLSDEPLESPFLSDTTLQGAVMVQPGVALGPWIVHAALAARGRMLVFLDDDDAFVPEKLSRVAEVLERHPEIGYFHNEQTPMELSPRGRGTGIPSGGRTTAAASPSNARPSWDALITRDAFSTRSVERLWRQGAAYNHSSAAASAQLVRDWSESLRTIEGGFTAFLFYAALAASSAIWIDSRRLTALRLAADRPPSLSASTPDFDGLRHPDRFLARARDADRILEAVRASGRALPSRPLIAMRERNLLAATLATGVPGRSWPRWRSYLRSSTTHELWSQRRTVARWFLRSFG